MNNSYDIGKIYMTNLHPQFIHSCYVRAPYGGDDAVIVKEVLPQEDGTGIPNLKIYKNPKRKFWVTKPIYRNHEFKKEYCNKDQLDEYICENRYMEYEIQKALDGYSGSYRVPISVLNNSPYVYGTIPVEVLTKMKYNDTMGDQHPVPFTTGFLDIETNMLTDEENIILITVTHEEKVYTAILDSFFYKVEKNDVRVKGTIEEVKRLAEETIYGPLDVYCEKRKIPKFKFDFNFFVGQTELELIEWIFQKIHSNKTDFIGIWNMDFDIPKILAAIRRAKADPSDILCHPDVPSQFRNIYYKQDQRDLKQLPHFTEKWHWATIPGYTQIVDSMNLYSRLRKVKGYKQSYTLNYILGEELRLQKLSLGDEGSHYIMQKDRFLDYVVYNIFDSISLHVLEKQNQDITTMSILAGNSLLSQFAYSTILVSNNLYEYCQKANMVTAAAGSKMETKYTKMFKKFGGTVLDPERNIGIGTKALIDRPDFETMMSAFVFDIDFSAYYPRVQCATNVSTETKLSSAIAIEGHRHAADKHDKISNVIHDYFSNITAVRENCVHICNKYFDLPSYTEMEDILLRT